MGWDFGPKSRSESLVDYFTNRYTHEGNTVEAVHVGRGAAYVAVRVHQPSDYLLTVYAPEPDGSIVMAGVCLYQGGYSQIGVKEMDETMGPNVSCAPVEFLDRLSDLRPQGNPDRLGLLWAHNWRDRCRKAA